MTLKKQTLVKLGNRKNIRSNHKIYYVRSFTEENKYYEVNRTRQECSCPYFQKHGKLCKHLKKVMGIEDVSGFGTGLLKSNLQKAIRKGLPITAVKTAKLLIKKDAKSFLRRLPVIVIEDVLLHPGYDKLVGLASASSDKDFVLQPEDKQFCLQTVEQLARCLYRDTEFLDYQQGRKELDLPSGIHGLSEQEQELARALKRRAGMGGMKDDMEMLRLTSRIWIRRFQNREFRISDLEKYFPKPEMGYSQLPERDASDDILKESVDFHVLKSIPKMILRKKKPRERLIQESGLSSESDLIGLLNNVTWRCRSGINNKIDINTRKEFDWLDTGEHGVYEVKDKEKFQGIYKIIAPELDRIAEWYIRKSLEN